MPRNEAAKAVLRVNQANSIFSEVRREYRIHFHSGTMFHQAMGSLASFPAGREGSSPEAAASGWLCEAEEPQDTFALQTELYRAQTMEVLEGLREPAKMYDFERSNYAVDFRRMARIEAAARRDRFPRARWLNDLDKYEDKTPLFSWRNMHRLLVSQLSEKDRAKFPAWSSGMKATMLFLSPKNRDGVRWVRNRHRLEEYSVLEVQQIMMDVAVRGWNDILWLSSPEDPLPLGFRDGEAIHMDWGQTMI